MQTLFNIYMICIFSLLQRFQPLQQQISRKPKTKTKTNTKTKTKTQAKTKTANQFGAIQS